MKLLQDWEGGRVWGPFLITKKAQTSSTPPTTNFQHFLNVSGKGLFPLLCARDLYAFRGGCVTIHQVTPGLLAFCLLVIGPGRKHLGPPGAFSSPYSIYPIGDRRPRSGEESRPQTWAPARPRHKLGAQKGSRASPPLHACFPQASRGAPGRPGVGRAWSLPEPLQPEPVDPRRPVSRGASAPCVRHASGPPPSPRLPVIRSRLRRVPGRKQRRGAGSARRRRRRRHGPPFIRSPRRQRRRPGPVRRGRAWAAGAAGARPAGSASRRRASSGRGRPIPP